MSCFMRSQGSRSTTVEWYLLVYIIPCCEAATYEQHTAAEEKYMHAPGCLTEQSRLRTPICIRQFTIDDHNPIITQGYSSFCTSGR